MICPQCSSETGVKYPRNGEAYCEDCGWPDDNWEEQPNCTICGKPSVGVCGEQCRCEEHWISVQQNASSEPEPKQQKETG